MKCALLSSHFSRKGAKCAKDAKNLMFFIFLANLARLASWRETLDRPSRGTNP